MFKVNADGTLDNESLAKASRSLASFFTKRAEQLEKEFHFHKTMAAQHEACKAAHTDQAAACKAVHDGMDDSHDLKHHFGKTALHHTSMAANHEAISKTYAAHADAAKAEGDALKATISEWGGTTGPVSSLFTRSFNTGTAPSPAPTGNVINDMVQETTVNLAKKSMELMDNDPEVKQYMRETIIKMIGETIGNTVVPTHVSAVTPTPPGITAVPRAGQKPVEKLNVELEFQDLVKIEDGREDR